MELRLVANVSNDNRVFVGSRDRRTLLLLQLALQAVLGSFEFINDHEQFLHLFPFELQLSFDVLRCWHYYLLLLGCRTLWPEQRILLFVISQGYDLLM